MWDTEFEAWLNDPDEAAAEAWIREKLNTTAGFAYMEAMKDRALKLGKNTPEQQQALLIRIEMALRYANVTNQAAMGQYAKGVCTGLLSDWQQSASATRIAWMLYAQLNDDDTYATLGGNLVWCFWSMRDVMQANAVAGEVNRALVARAYTGDKLGYLWRNWAYIKCELGEVDQAIKLMDQARSNLWPFLPEDQKEHFLSDYHAILSLTNQYITAEAGLKQAQQFFEQRPNQTYHQAVTAIQLAALYKRSGQLHLALEGCNRAIALYHQSDTDQETIARAVVCKARTLLELAQYPQALAELKSVAPILQKPLERSLVQLWQAAAYIDMRSVPNDQADTILGQQIEQLQKDYPRWADEARLLRLQLYVVDKRYPPDDLIALYDRLVQTRPLHAANVCMLMSQCELNRDDLQAAEAWLERLAQIIETWESQQVVLHDSAENPAPTNVVPQMVQTNRHFLLGQLCQRRNMPAMARQHYEQAWGGVEQQRMAFYLEGLQVGVIARRERQLQQMLEFYVAQADVEAAWRYAELLRAHTLMTTLARESLLPMSQGEQSAEMKQLLQKRVQRHQLCSDLYRLFESEEAEQGRYRSLSVADSAELQQQIAHLDTEMADLYDVLYPDAAYALNPYRGREPITIAQCALAIPDRTLLLEFTQFDEYIVVTGIDAAGSRFRQRLSVTKQKLETLIRKYTVAGFERWKSFLMGGPERFEDLLAYVQRRLLRLYQALWQPLRSHVSAYDHVVIIPYEDLYQVPFHALFDGESYVLDHKTISYAPSATLYTFCQRRASRRANRLGQDVALFAYQGSDKRLHGAIDEVQRLRAELFQRAKLYVHDDASAENLKHIAPTARILHLATHGKLVPEIPFLSYLELASNGKTARFYLYDAAALDLQQTDLVALVACETGQATTRGGDFLGLQWGFINAGAYALLANQLPIEDWASSQLMPEFYRHYQASEHKADALRQAQIALRQRGEQAADNTPAKRLAHPYSWTPFVCYGYAGIVPSNPVVCS